MRKRIFFALFALVQTIIVQGQESKEILPVVKLGDQVQVKFGGFARGDYFIDSRKNFDPLDGLFNLWPEPAQYDAQGNDMNDVVRHNFSMQASRFSGLFTGPDVLKAKSSAYFEFDFSGGNTINVRMRQAWVKLNWTKSELQLGKTWHPLFSPIMPSAIAISTGAPFQPFHRAEQIRFTQKMGNLTLLAAAVYQSEHKSFSYSYNAAAKKLEVGQIGDNTRLNPIPDMNLQLHVKTGSFFTGLMGEYKIIRPTLFTVGSDTKNYKTKETVSSYALGWFGEYKHNLLTVKGNAMYGQNMAEFFMQGGYAVASIDSSTGYRTYTPSNAITSWLNITYGKKIVAGIFGGYQKNLGFSDPILGGSASFLGRAQNIAYMYRVAPSISYYAGRMVFAFEVEYNTAAFGTIDYADYGKVKDAKETSNLRGLGSVTFYF